MTAIPLPLDTAPEACGHCRRPLVPGGPSDLFCNETCQDWWNQNQARNAATRPLIGAGSLGRLATTKPNPRPRLWQRLFTSEVTR